MHVTEVFEKFISGKLVMDDQKARDITNLVTSVQAEFGQWASFPLEEDPERMESLLSDYENLVGQEVTFKKILDVAENYDIWHNKISRNIEEAAAVLLFISSMVKIYGTQGSK